MSGSPKTGDDNLSTGASEAEAARPVPFRPGREGHPGKGGKQGDDGQPDAAEAAGTKRKSGDHEPAPEPGAVRTSDLNTENDDGVS
jgi:hypothetical protein